MGNFTLNRPRTHSHGGKFLHYLGTVFFFVKNYIVLNIHCQGDYSPLSESVISCNNVQLRKASKIIVLCQFHNSYISVMD